jgi:hypothetical protein
LSTIRVIEYYRGWESARASQKKREREQAEQDIAERRAAIKAKAETNKSRKEKRMEGGQAAAGVAKPAACPGNFAKVDKRCFILQQI